jgi:hypothetical protein
MATKRINDKMPPEPECKATDIGSLDNLPDAIPMMEETISPNRENGSNNLNPKTQPPERNKSARTAMPYLATLMFGISAERLLRLLRTKSIASCTTPKGHRAAQKYRPNRNVVISNPTPIKRLEAANSVTSCTNNGPGCIDINLAARSFPEMTQKTVNAKQVMATATLMR